MADIIHEIDIQAPPERIYEALTTDDGLKAWWTTDAHTDARTGGSATFGFNNKATVFNMNIEDVRRNERLVWRCTGDPDEWAGTRLVWDITPRDQGGTNLRMIHSNWQSITGEYAKCNTTWGELMHRLKGFAEGKEPGPLWNE